MQSRTQTYLIDYARTRVILSERVMIYPQDHAARLVQGDENR